MTATLPTSIRPRTFAEKRYLLKVKTQTANVKQDIAGEPYMRVFLTTFWSGTYLSQQAK